MDKITMTGIELYAYHGVRESERLHGQVFFLDLEIEADLSAARASDQLGDTVNYSQVIDCAASVFCARPYKLIERAAEVTAQALLEQFPRIEALRLRVHKPDAPAQHTVSDITLEIQLIRGELGHE